MVKALAVLLGVALTLAMQGYQFGRSNHTVYLLDALHQAWPNLLADDWYTTQTLQYHAIFGWMTRVLLRAGIIEPAFFIGYLLLVLLFHLAWWKIVRALGADVVVFLLSEILFHLSGAGTGLGMYQFIQDAAFLPSNVANVALLWGICFALTRQSIACGLCIGVAGLFHLNHAVVTILMCPFITHTVILSEAKDLGGQSTPRSFASLRMTKQTVTGATIAIALCLISIGLALRVGRGDARVMPLSEFVDLYVRLRHPHHYDPLSWPIALWVSFLWPIPLAALARFPSAGAAQIAQRIFLLFIALLLVALIAAGVWYLSETLIQMSLYRFSIFPKLLSCIGAAQLLYQIARPRYVAIATLFAAAGMIILGVMRGPYFGLFQVPGDDQKFIAACDWIRVHTPTDAVFLVPPSEQSFRWRARRSIVINFKGIGQLNSEVAEWRDRLKAVLGMADLTILPHPFEKTLNAIRDRYESLPPEHLIAVASRYGARFILIGHSFGPAYERQRVSIDGNDSYFLYDLSRQGKLQGERAMDVKDVRERLLARYGIRVEPEMSRYVLRQLRQAGDALRQVPVMGGDAKTGTPRRVMVDPAELSDLRTRTSAARR